MTTTTATAASRTDSRPASPRLANPRRTTLAALRSGTRCQVAGPGCRGAATRLLASPSGTLPACAVCRPA